MGVDSIALAGLDLNVCAWDLDPQAVAAATVNLRFHENAEVNHGDVTKLDISELISEGVEGIFADPARHTGLKAEAAESTTRRLVPRSIHSPVLARAPSRLPARRHRHQSRARHRVCAHPFRF